jgi:hypothetical protein
MTITNGFSASFDAIITGSGSDLVLNGTSNSSVTLIYNSTIQRWVVISSSGSLGGGAWQLVGNSATNDPALPATYGTTTIAANENWIGTTDANDWVIGTNNIERMRIKQTGAGTTPGYIGIGTAAPSGHVHVYTVSDVNKSGVLSYSSQLAVGIDYQNRGVVGQGKGLLGGTVKWGLGVGVMGIGDQANSYYATGVYAGLGTTIPNAPLSDQALYANGANLGYSGIFMNGNVGVGTNAPSRLLHINSATNGAIRIVDGTQGLGKVLTSDATGVGTWQDVSINNVIGTLGPGVNIPHTTTNFLQTGSYIDLPAGKFAVSVTMLLSPVTITPNNSTLWLRSTFSDSNAPNPTFSPDIVGVSRYCSGLAPGTTIYAPLSGTIIINNTSGATKRYYYVAGSVDSWNLTATTLSLFGGNNWNENTIIAYRIQ